MPPMPGRPGANQGPPQGPMPMGPMGIPPQYRGMMPPYMFGRNFPGPGFPPNYPGMPPRPFPYDGRFPRGPPPPQNRQQLPPPGGNNDEERDPSFRAAIITDKDLKNFDQILKSEASDGGWAGAQGEIDYRRERKKKANRGFDVRDHRGDGEDDYDDRHTPRSDRDRVEGHRRSPLDKDNDQEKDSPSSGNIARENWHGPVPPQFRGQPRPPHPGMDGRGWPMHPFDYGMRAPFPFRMPHPGQRPPFGHPSGPPPPQQPSPSKKSTDDDDEMWQQRRQQSTEEVHSAVQRARARREESEKKSEAERKAAAQEKLKQLEERVRKREDSKTEDDDKKSEVSRTSESSEKDPRERDPPRAERVPSRDGSKGNQSNYNKSRNTVPPRFQKQQQEQMRQGGGSGPTSQSPTTPGTHSGMPPQGFRQGPPPPWPYDPRAWGAMPPFMDPRYAGRPPVDMQGMPMFPAPVRRRTDSHGSGADSQDDNRPPSEGNYEQQQRDHRNWMEGRGFPPPHPGAFDEMRRAQYYYQQEYERYEQRNSRDFERQNTTEEDVESATSEHDSYHKEDDDHRDSSRDVFDEINDKNDRHDHKGEDKVKESHKDKGRGGEKEEKKKDSRTSGDDSIEEKEDRWTGHGQYPSRPVRHGSSPGSLRSYNSEHERPRRENYHYCPPPMPQPQQPPPSRSTNYTSLKRSASSMSTSSNTSQERKSDSPKEISNEKLHTQKESPKETIRDVKIQTKDLKSSESRNDRDYEKPKRNEVSHRNESRDVRLDSRDHRQDPRDRQDSRDHRQNHRDSRPDTRNSRDNRQDRDHDNRSEQNDSRRENHWDNRQQPSPKSKWDKPPSKNDWIGKTKKPEWEKSGRNDRDTRSPKTENEPKSQKNEWEPKPQKTESWEPKNKESNTWDSKPVKLDSQETPKPKAEVEVKPQNYWERNKEKQEEQKRAAAEKDKENVEKQVEESPKSPTEKKQEHANQSGRPPVKRKKDEDYRYDSRQDRYRDDGRMSGRGREFVRGRGRGRARSQRGSYTSRGRGRADYRSYDRSYQSSGRSDYNAKGSIGRWGENEDEAAEDFEASKRRRGKDEDSDVSVDDTSGSFSETSSERTSEARDNSRPKDSSKDSKPKSAKDDTKHQPKSENRDNREKRDSNERNSSRNSHNHRDHRGGYNDKRYDDRYRNNEHQDGGPRNNAFVPRGEPSRRGRGGNSVPRGGPRGKRYMSGPPRGGFGRPPSNSGESRNRDNQNDSREYRRSERNQPPPRFARRGGFQDRGRGYERGPRGRGRGRGSNSAPSRPPLAKQMSNEGEEWETASESSDFNRDSKNDKDGGGKDRREPPMSKKSFSNQRPLNDRQNRRVPTDNRNMGGNDNRNNKEKSPNPTKNGTGPPRNGNGGPKNKASMHSNYKENVNVYRVDSIVHTDQTAINNAINNISIKKRKSELSDVSKPLPTEKEKKDALANIDINNYASVVVIDDQPEVTIDDPTFLFEKDDGFQEVTYKKAVPKKKQETELKKTEVKKGAKVVAKPKGMSSAKIDRQRYGKSSRLPPRLARKKEEEEKEKEMSKNIMPKIEQWDNDLANDIPANSTSLDIDSTKSMTTVAVTPVVKTTTVSVPSAPAPVPTVSAWTKPINFSVSASGHEMKFEKGGNNDNHDSGIDVVVDTFKASDMEIGEFEAPKPQRQPKISTGSTSARGVKPITKDIQVVSVVDDLKKQSTEIIKEQRRITTIEKTEPIQMPAFKDTLFGKGDNTMNLDFEFDATLVNITETRIESEQIVMSSTDVCKPVSTSSVTGTSQPVITSPTSPSTQDLNQKIAQVKKVWESSSMKTVYEKPMPESTTPRQSISSSIDESLSNSNNNNTFDSFPTSEVERALTPVQNNMDNVISSRNDLSSYHSDSNNFSPSQSSLSPRPHDYLNFSNTMDMKMENDHKPNYMSEPSNVCKVKPQQFQTIDFIMSNTNNLMSSMSAVPSPPVVVQNQPPPFQTIQLGSQLLTPESRFSQPSFGFSLSQNQSQLGQQQLGQSSSFSQPSLFVPTPNQDLYQQQPSQLAPFQRNHSFNQTPQQNYGQTQQNYGQTQQNYGQTQQNYGQNPTHNTIMVSSTSSLMSTSIKPPSTNNYGSLQKNMSSGSVQYNQGLNSSSVHQPSQMYIQYEPTTPMFGNNQILTASNQPNPSQNASQLIGSQLVQQRSGVHNVQSVQPSSYFPQSQPTLSQTGYFSSQSQPSSALQGALQQVAASGPQFSIHTFNNAGQGLGLALQQTSGANTTPHINLGNTGSNQAGMNKPNNQFSSFIQQQSQSNQNNQMKSPSQNITPSNMLNTALSALSPNSKVFTSQVQQNRPPPQQRFPGVTQLPQGNKFNNAAFVAQQLSGAASVVRPSIMVGGMVRPNTAPPQPSRGSFPPPIQRPGLSNTGVITIPTQSLTPVIPAALQQGATPSMKALHEKQRREVLAHAQSFLNPQNKPKVKSLPKSDISDEKSPSDAVNTAESKSESSVTSKEK
ncbi:hypothetical protein LOTGIDRAFT_229985 [Lottia gigantea]|uniref:BAT2 N-terminal domain-containing protein n=1 Tax=Lottia gigantea TaxID=225164 RepID=V4BGE4_LOTGI|nr:hypothetical protein LOTGIDRAFT_229985 [Lottia gigantea]ESP04907.1 hypothetical protein LOTGIDRAFT_229985 [Lottia gigantea]